MKDQQNSLISFCMWILPLSFFAYQFILRLWPSLMMHQIMQQLTIDATAFGFLSSVYYWGYAGMQIPIAFALNRFSVRHVVFWCALLCCIGTLLFSFTSNWYCALLSRFLVGAGSAAGFLSTSKVISEWFDKDQYSKMIGFTFTFGMLGAIYAGKPVSLLIDSLGWQTVAIVLGLFALVIGILTLLVLKDSNVAEGNVSEESLQLNSLTMVLKSPTLWILAIANLLMVGSLEGFADVWGVNYLMTAYDLSKGNAAQLISFIFVGMLFGGPVLAYFGKKLSNYTVISLCGCGMALLFTVLIFMHQLSWFSLATLFFCIGVMCCYQVLIFAVGSELVSAQSLGITIAFLNCINMLGGSFFHTLIGCTMDIFWTGTMIGELRSYTITSYQYSLMVIPFCAVVGALLIKVVALLLRKCSKQILLLLMMCTQVDFFTIGMEQKKAVISYKDITTSVLIGSITGATEVAVNQPLIYFKNMLQQKIRIPFNPKVWYRGLGVGLACMAPTTAIQFATEHSLQHIFSGTDPVSVTLRAAGAGAFSALASTPTELIVLHQQNSGLSSRKTIFNLVSQEGMAGLMRGIPAKTLRDSLFCVGLLSMYPFFEQQIRIKLIDNKSIATVGAGVIAGGLTAVISHPFDTISTLMQSDYNKRQFPTMRKAIIGLYQKEGLGSFFKGGMPRGMRIILAIPLMNNVKNTLNDCIYCREEKE